MLYPKYLTRVLTPTVFFLLVVVALSSVNACTVTHSAMVHAELIHYVSPDRNYIYDGSTTYVVWNLTIENFRYYELFRNMSFRGQIAGVGAVPWAWLRWWVTYDNDTTKTITIHFNVTPVYWYHEGERRFVGTFILPFTNVTVGGTVAKKKPLLVNNEKWRNVTVIYQVLNVMIDITLLNETMNAYREYLIFRGYIRAKMAGYFANLYGINYSVVDLLLQCDDQYFHDAHDWFMNYTSGHAEEIRYLYFNVTDYLRKIINLDWLEWSLENWNVTESSTVVTFSNETEKTIYYFIEPVYDLSYTTTLNISGLDPEFEVSFSSPPGTKNVYIDGNKATFVVEKVIDVKPIVSEEPEQEESPPPSEEQPPEQTAPPEVPEGPETPPEDENRTYLYVVVALIVVITVASVAYYLKKKR